RTRRDPQALHSFPTRRSSDLGNTPSLGTTDPVTRATRLTWSVKFTFARSSPAATTTAVASVARDVPGKNMPAYRKSAFVIGVTRSEEHTSELQSRGHLVCRPL